MAKLTHDELLGEIARMHDENLLRLVKKGTFTTIGTDGKPVEIDLTAAMLNAVTNRLKACNVTSATKPGETLGELEKELASSGLKLRIDLPAHNYEDDAASA